VAKSTGSAKRASREKRGRPRRTGALSSVPVSLQAKMRESRVARLTTIGERRVLHAVPVCFVCHRGAFYSPIDRKPKNVAPEKLARLRNIAATPQVALLIDHYEEDWTKLWFILIRGKATQVPSSARRERTAAIRALKKKYPQYAAGMLADDALLLRIIPRRASHWQSF
jgi:PPOX class probable F420-dependent enzyme